MDYKKLIGKLKKKDKSSGLKLDLLRVMVVNIGSRWQSDLSRDISLFRQVLDKEKEVPENELNNALQDLEKNGLIETEARPKATRGGSEPDVLVSLSNPSDIREAFADDEILMEYRRKAKLEDNF